MEASIDHPSTATAIPPDAAAALLGADASGHVQWSPERRETDRLPPRRPRDSAPDSAKVATMPMPQDDDTCKRVTRLLQGLGDAKSVREELLPLVYQELRAIAQRRMSAERPDHTLQATALVHEAYMRLVSDRSLAWEKRSSFYAAAAEAMRRILVDHARRRKSQKRGQARPHVPLTGIDVADDANPDQILALDEALTRLAEEDARAAEVVRFRFFAGLSVEETARAMDVSPRTVLREWSFARARLFQLLHPDEE
jgi:RNA polymerase sigma factor (TIGR02999 family)